jgi:PAS domain S-box-containing protein
MPFENMELLHTSILKTIPHPVLGLQERVIIFTNDATERVFGWKAEELIGKSTRVLYRTDEEYELIGTQGYGTIDKWGTYTTETPCRRKDGTVIICRLTAAPIGRHLHEKRVVAVFEDITEQKRMFEALSASEEKYRNLYENAVEGVYRSTKDKLLEVNPALARMHGFGSPEEMLRSMRNVKDELWIDPKEHERYKRLLDEQGFVKGFENQVYRKDGSKIWTSLNSRAIYYKAGEFLYYQGTVVDITERKQAEEALRESEEKFKLLFEKSAEPILLLDNGVYVDCNEAAVKLMGATGKDRLTGLHVLDISRERQPDGRLSSEKVPELIELAMKEGTSRFEWMHRGFDGRELWVEVSLTVIPIHGRRLLYTVWRDIGERKKAEELLRESEERYRTAIERSNDGVVVTGERVLFANKRFLEIFGFERYEDVVGKPPGQTIHPDDRERVTAIIKRRHQNQPAPDRYEMKGIKRTGETIFIEVSAARIIYDGNPTTLAYMRGCIRKKAHGAKAP